MHVSMSISGSPPLYPFLHAFAFCELCAGLFTCFALLCPLTAARLAVCRTQPVRSQADGTIRRTVRGVAFLSLFYVSLHHS